MDAVPKPAVHPAAQADVKPSATLEYERVMLADASDILHAHTRARIMHRGRNIRAAGEEVEYTVRQLLARRLPRAYYVGQGHIVDTAWHQSPDFDVVIADNTYAPVLFEAADGTQYFPYEAVFAVGEVKAGFRRAERPFEKFGADIRALRTNLSRAQTPLNYLGHGIQIQGAKANDRRSYRNPLFTFMLFASSKGLSIDAIADHYTTTDVADLPSVVALLDQGVVARATIIRQEIGYVSSGWHVTPVAEPSPPVGSGHAWALAPFGDGETRHGRVFGFLYGMLLAHLSNCFLRAPRIIDYMGPLFPNEAASIVTDIAWNSAEGVVTSTDVE